MRSETKEVQINFCTVATGLQRIQHRRETLQRMMQLLVPRSCIEGTADHDLFQQLCVVLPGRKLAWVGRAERSRVLPRWLRPVRYSLELRTYYDVVSEELARRSSGSKVSQIEAYRSITNFESDKERHQRVVREGCLIFSSSCPELCKEENLGMVAAALNSLIQHIMRCPGEWGGLSGKLFHYANIGS